MNGSNTLLPSLPIIHCSVFEYVPYVGVMVVAVDTTDGTIVASCVSSNVDFAMHDIGITSERQHDKYKAKHPHGYELHWIGA